MNSEGHKKKRDEFDWAWQAGAVDEILSGLDQRARRRRRYWSRAVLGVAALLVGGLWWQTSIGFQADKVAKDASSTLVLLTPPRRELPDGSWVELKHDAEIAIDFSDQWRRVTLTRGTAHFKVAKDAQRPFVVQAAALAVRAVGTAFTVELAPHGISVLVTEGRVAVDHSPSFSGPDGGAASGAEPSVPLLVEAGASIELDTSLPSSVPLVRPLATPELNEKVAWRLPRLEFAGSTLGEVVAMMNQHNREQFQIADPSLAHLRLSGVLRADKVAALIQMLEADFPVVAERQPDRIVLRRRE